LSLLPSCLSSISKVFKIIEKISSFSYGYEIMIVAQWRDVSYLECDSYQQATDLTSEEPSICFHNGKQIIASYGYSTVCTL
ncbi:hypothetical protein LSH36_566g01068, partial [Paralvinella palmiformis]